MAANSPAEAPAPTLLSQVLEPLPGVLFTAAVAWLGMRASVWLGETLLGFEKSPISGIMMAIVIGLLIANVITLPRWLRPGIRFSLKRLLRVGIILLGIRLSLGEVLRLGSLGVPLIVFCVVGAMVVVRVLGRALQLSERMSTLIGVGTSICGATAIVATGPVIDAKEEEVAYAVANITVFGIVAMLLYPFLGHALFGSDATSAGLFLGTSIHETAQVAGSGLIYAEQFDADEALDVATVTKLVRNVLMALVIPLTGYLYQRRHAVDPGASRGVSLLRLFPAFILGFLLLALIRTLGDATLDSSGAAWGLWDEAQWRDLTETVRQWAEALLGMAMAAVGLSTGVQQLRGLGLRPFYVGLGAALAVGVLSLAGIALLSAAGLT